MESIPPSKRNTQADIQLRTRQTNHQQETDGCIQIKHNPEHQPSRMSSKSTAYVPPKTASTPTKANTQTCSYLEHLAIYPQLSQQLRQSTVIHKFSAPTRRTTPLLASMLCSSSKKTTKQPRVWQAHEQPPPSTTAATTDLLIFRTRIKHTNFTRNAPCTVFKD